MDWSAQIPNVVIVISALWALIVFLHARDRESKLKRTDYVFQLWQAFHNDPKNAECIAIVEGRDSITIEEFCRVVDIEGQLKPEELKLYQKFEHFLSFLWTVAYANSELKIIKDRDLNLFGHWFERVCESERLKNYCCNVGYDEIIYANERIEPLKTPKKLAASSG